VFSTRAGWLLRSAASSKVFFGVRFALPEKKKIKGLYPTKEKRKHTHLSRLWPPGWLSFSPSACFQVYGVLTFSPSFSPLFLPASSPPARFPLGEG